MLNLRPEGQKGEQTMGIPNEPFICPSLARGIRRAYLETLYVSWADFGQRVKAFRRRTGGIEITSLKAFRGKMERFRTNHMPGSLSAADIGVDSDHAINQRLQRAHSVARQHAHSDEEAIHVVSPAVLIWAASKRTLGGFFRLRLLVPSDYAEKRIRN